jgi:hypothetical protein
LDKPNKKEPRHFSKEPILCNFDKVELKVPRLKLLRLLFKRTYLDYAEVIFLKALLWQAEAAENKILHIQSIIRKALFKASGRTVY